MRAPALRRSRVACDRSAWSRPRSYGVAVTSLGRSIRLSPFAIEIVPAAPDAATSVVGAAPASAVVQEQVRLALSTDAFTVKLF